ncbi:putative membrane protein [Bacteroides fragilis str. 3996 N(B) 6]|nr:putative membrane protein [Bacteroides fragilis str. 3996 N(B) 6]
MLKTPFLFLKFIRSLYALRCLFVKYISFFSFYYPSSGFLFCLFV